MRSDISFDDNPNIASVTSTEPLNSNKTSSVVGSISKNIYNTGISTLGLISRKTAGIVGSLNLTKIDRKTLKMPLSEHLEETGVMRAIEQLQLMSTQTSINLKCRMRELPPQELCRVQEILKNDQKLKLSFLSNPIEPLVLAECDSTPWESISLLPNMEAARIQRVLRTLKANLQLPSIEITMKEIDDLRAAVDSPLPPDQTSLILFLGRRRLATILGASCELFSIINCADLAALSHIISVIAGSLVTTMYYSKASETRQETLLLAIKADVDQAMGILSDASGTLEPACRLIIFENI